MSGASSSEPERSITRPAHAAAFAAVRVFGFTVLRILAMSAYTWDTDPWDLSRPRSSVKFGHATCSLRPATA
ncbi:hypothetical protein E9229_000913 [Paeniglutamicibacter cryotolerans]|uniref:Uncharacterized protein n=1 Tax=Paeniglutamicibacter cryotolerans TaxID=670079 RepID=A0A839QND0_9MICC|nr:hypothetical protein [Paeniglutamicibacter cryotolerans]